MAMDKSAKNGTYVYGLDIGTRSIVGTVGYRQKDRFCIVAQQSIEHESRAMLDGQIHDINTVSETISEVTRILEERVKQPLKQVCIAAAGRVLKTVTVHVDMELDGEKTVSKEDIYALDSLGIEKAYETFVKSDDYDETMKFYCVGYSVMHYYMNGYLMNQLENHKAKEISADLIATFLPDDVVDGLYKSVELAGLEVSNLTLEPIAAIELAIPEMYRMLNIALIDVGAGTSDISITKDGSIVAYGMLPIAGDCLTEDIARHCLVDFYTAEQIKRGIDGLDCEDSIEYKDIMGISQKISKKEVLEVIADDLENMAKQAADKIKELNGNKPVSAVFVVGGGGKIDTYTERVAKHLGIAKERCAVRGEEVMSKIDFLEKNAKKDSLLVTPIGICLNFYEQSNNFIFVNFNDQRIKLYDNGHLAIVDAAISAEFSNEDLFPKRGESLEFVLNGQPVTIRGKRGESATVWLNGEETDIHAAIRSNDIIRVIPSTAGEKADMIVSKLPGYQGNLTVRFEDKDIVLPKLACVNGMLQSAYYEIQNGDQVELLDYYTVKQIMEFMDVPADTIEAVYVNHEEAYWDTKVYHNFTVAIKTGEAGTKETGAEEETDASVENIRTDDFEIDDIRTGNVETDDIRIKKKQSIDVNANGTNTDKTRFENDQSEKIVPEKTGTDIGTLSSIEKAKANAQKTIEQLQFEHAEEGLMAMIQSAMNLTGVSGKGAANQSVAVTNSHKSHGQMDNRQGGTNTEVQQAAPRYPKVEKSARELYSSIQSNINRLKNGEAITTLRDEAIKDEVNLQTEGQIAKTDEASDETTAKVRQTGEIVIPAAETVVVNGKMTQTIHVLVNDELVTLKGKPDYIYVDVFQFYEFDLSRPKGKAVVTMINGREAQYIEPLANGDRLQIYWRD